MATPCPCRPPGAGGHRDQEELEAGRLQALVLWDKESEVSEKYAGNLERLLGQMEFSWELLDIRQKDAVSYTDYDLVIVGLR